MEKLELKHLAPYLPYGLKVVNIGNNIIREFTYELENPSDIKRQIAIQMLLLTNHVNKPILRPLSDLTKEIEVNGERFVPMDKINKRWKDVYSRVTRKKKLFDKDCIKEGLMVWTFPYEVVTKMHEWHFDTEGLIEKGLAIDVNTLKQ